MNKKGVSVGVNTIFYIMMGIIFIGIIMFGVSKISQTENLISEQERLKVKTQLKETLEFCGDPINKGSSKMINVQHPVFNSICILGTGVNYDDFATNIRSDVENDFNLILEGEDNVVLLKTEYRQDTGLIAKAQVMDSFAIEYDGPTKCLFDKENDGVIKAVFHCE